MGMGPTLFVDTRHHCVVVRSDKNWWPQNTVTQERRAKITALRSKQLIWSLRSKWVTMAGMSFFTKTQELSFFTKTGDDKVHCWAAGRVNVRAW